MIVQNLALIELASPEIWTSVAERFANKKMNLFIPLSILNKTFLYLSYWKSPPKNLMKSILQTLIEHRLGFKPLEQEKLIEAAKQCDLLEGSDLEMISE